MQLVSLALCLLSAADALRLEQVVSRRALARAVAIVPAAGLAQAATAARVSNAAAQAQWKDSASSNIVLGYSKEGLKPGFDAELTGKLGLQDGKRTTAEGSAFKTESLTSSPGAAANLPARSGGNIPTIRIAGKWSDAAHPGCTRKIQLSAKQAFIAGADEDGKPWKAVGTINGDDIIIDFSAKGGPKDVKATFVIGKGITFPDGNVWTRIS